MSANLTQAETAERAAMIVLDSQRVEVDLRDCRDLDQPTFTVRSTITLTASAPETWLDFIGDAVTAVLVDGAQRPVDYDGARILLTDLPTGRPCTVVVEAAARYSRSGEGLHRFRDPADGETYLYTQYEPADARRVFPTMEQPDLKARFSFVLTAPEEWQILSNGAEVDRATTGDGCVTVTFAETPPMSTYLTCIVAGPYRRWTDAWTAPDGTTLDLSWSCRESVAEHLDVDLLFDTTKKGLAILHERFGAYPWGPTYDQVLVPEYNLGAMENPGLVTFTEHYVFRSPATPAQYQGRANTVLHEMSHFWFGDLVTPRWWGDLWLKESFAEFMGTWLSDGIGYTDAWLNFAGRRKAGAYVADAMPTTHPVVADIPDLEAAKNNFDRITYSKGASALTQLVHYVGLDSFFAGARRYFAAHAFSSATLGDFLDAVAAESGRDLREWSRQWLETSGHDVLTPVPTMADGRLTSLLITRGVAGDAQPADRPHATTVGLFDLVDGHLVLRRRIDVRITSGETMVDVGGEAAPAAIIVNDTDRTFARIGFDDATRDVLRAHVGDLGPLTRAVVWAALWAEVRDGRMPVADYLDTVATHGPAESETGTLSAMLDNLRVALGSYLSDPVSAASAVRDAAVAAARSAEPGSPQQLLWVESYLDAAALTDADVSWVATEGLDGLPVTPDLRWHVARVRATQGRISDQELDDLLRDDRTATGEMAHLRAVTSRPDPEVKAEAWRRAHVVGGEANDAVDALLLGIFAPGQDQSTFAAPYFETLRDVWREHPIEIARRLVLLGYPRDVASLPASTAWLHANPDAPAALRRLVVERDHELRVAERLRTQG